MDFRNRKVVIITGAGATRSEAADDIPDEDKPPLDKGFFADAQKAEGDEFPHIKAYMLKHYGIDPAENRHDSLENIMGVIYSDATHSIRGANTEEQNTALRNILSLVPRRITATTNDLPVSRGESALSGVVCGFLDGGCPPRNLIVVTFNYDLHAEKVLHDIGGAAFSFPHCYCLPKRFRITRPRGDDDIFRADKKDRGGVRVLKLHGSLNWRSIHKSQSPPSAQEMLASEIRHPRITPRMKINNDMGIYEGKNRRFTHPLIIPPVAHKAAFLRSSLVGVWANAHKALQAATDVVIFGYSCPPQDVESANLISGVFHRNPSARVSVIDPSSATFRRYIDLTGMDSLHFYRSARAFNGAR